MQITNKTKKLSASSMLLALSIILPQAFHMVPNAGSIFLPMHIPVLICGFIVGPIYGLIVGLMAPLISHIIFSMPQVIMLKQMEIELSMYGFLAGIFNQKIKIKNKYIKCYICLILSMIISRIIYGLMNALLFKANSYSLSIWLTGSFITGLPGIIIQLIVIPIIVINAEKIN